MTVEELKKSSPVLVNRDVWQRIKNENSSIGETSDKINFTAIHLYYKSIFHHLFFFLKHFLCDLHHFLISQFYFDLFD